MLIYFKNKFQFQELRKKGFEIKTFTLVARVCEKSVLEVRNFEESGIYVGLTISGKVGNAVKRNLSRRRIKAILREKLDPELTDLAISLFPRKSINAVEFFTIKRDLLYIQKKIKERLA